MYERNVNKMLCFWYSNCTLNAVNFKLKTERHQLKRKMKNNERDTDNTCPRRNFRKQKMNSSKFHNKMTSQMCVE